LVGRGRWAGELLLATQPRTVSGLPRRDRGKALADGLAEVTRCPAIEGAQQCVAAAHSKMQNHRWGPKGETDQWGADGIAKPPDVQLVAPPVRAEAEAVHPVWGERWVEEPDATLVTGNAAVVSAAASPRGGQTVDPPATPDTSPAVPEPSPTAGSGGGTGRPLDITPGKPLTDQEVAVIKENLAARPPHTTRSIGTVIANTALDAALGVPVSVQDEMAHGREATDLLVTAAADQWRHNQPMPYARLLDLQAVVEHMVEARKVIR
jgi:hypothetical protein